MPLLIVVGLIATLLWAGASRNTPCCPSCSGDALAPDSTWPDLASSLVYVLQNTTTHSITASATVRAYQAAVGLRVTGVWDSVTLTHVASVLGVDPMTLPSPW